MKAKQYRNMWLFSGSCTNKASLAFGRLYTSFSSIKRTLQRRPPSKPVHCNIVKNNQRRTKKQLSYNNCSNLVWLVYRVSKTKLILVVKLVKSYVKCNRYWQTDVLHISVQKLYMIWLWWLFVMDFYLIDIL